MKKDYISKIKFIVFIGFIATAIFCLINNWEAIRGINFQSVLAFIEEKGAFAAVVYLLLFIVKPFFMVIPANIIAIVAGVLFGPIKGFILTMIGFFISGTIAFYISRFLGRDFVEGLLGKRFMKVDDNIEKNGFKILFLLRLPPILPYDPLSYACGFTKIKYKDFILASVLGVVPETICYSLLGKNLNKPLSIEFILPIIILILGVALSKPIMDRKNKIKKA